MKRILLVWAVVFLAATAYGQKVNFSGSWVLNKDASDLGYDFSLAPKSMVLEHAKKTLDVERHAEWDGQVIVSNDHFTLDGKVCVNTAWMDTDKESTVEYNKKKGLLTITTTVPMPDGGEATIIDEYSMDGEQLVINCTASSSMGEMVEKMVFDRQ